MDDAEKAEHQEELARQAAINRRKPVPKHDGHCLNCGENIGRAYCDAACREDDEQFQRTRHRNGW